MDFLSQSVGILLRLGDIVTQGRGTQYPPAVGHHMVTIHHRAGMEYLALDFRCLFKLGHVDPLVLGMPLLDRAGTADDAGNARVGKPRGMSPVGDSNTLVWTGHAGDVFEQPVGPLPVALVGQWQTDQPRGPNKLIVLNSAVVIVPDTKQDRRMQGDVSRRVSR